jgi:hypothetical protein
VHSGLHPGIEILHAETQAVKAQFAHMGQALGRGGARIYLDRDFRVGFEAEGASQVLHQTRQFLVGQKGRRAASEMQLRYGYALAQFAHMQLDLGRQGVQIAGGAVVVASHHLVTGAVITDRFTERDVHVERQRLGRRRRAALLQRLPVLLLAEAAVIPVSRGIRGIAGPVLVQPRQQLRREQWAGGGGLAGFCL